MRRREDLIAELAEGLTPAPRLASATPSAFAWLLAGAVAVAAITLATPEPKIVLTTNQPGVDYYLRRQVFSGVKVLDPEVVSIESWDIRRAGGGEPYMQLLLERALEEERRLYVTLTEPELHEKDPGGGLIGWVRRNGHLMQRYPAWTGPKDMTIQVYHWRR